MRTHSNACDNLLISSTVANLSSIYGCVVAGRPFVLAYISDSSYLWPSSSAPRYAIGFGTTAAFCFACSVAALLARYLFARYPYQFDFERWADNEVTDGGEDQRRVKDSKSSK